MCKMATEYMSLILASIVVRKNLNANSVNSVISAKFGWLRIRHVLLLSSSSIAVTLKRQSKRWTTGLFAMHEYVAAGPSLGLEEEMPDLTLRCGVFSVAIEDTLAGIVMARVDDMMTGVLDIGGKCLWL